MRRGILSLIVLALSGCGTLTGLDREPAAPASRPGEPMSAMAPPAEARTVEEFDTTSPQQRAAATVAPRGPEDLLGRSVASLGDPADPGFWAVTPLVPSTRQGRLVDPATGFSVLVELRPRDADAGAGTLVSLPALRALGVVLTDLREIAIYAAPR
ncbi:hypothetical protein SAMN05444722_1180 [Rhodovulum sp. ES.010]|uniref:hypothetical protein n=1 Tax=Rhodovulum sp. ES.010 TaxID=1882821 RepID=UPI000925C825|nr:hypothetical protein [Rhodovulum sp. ES.010]SIO28100.1 hypothetical protein SAMN05444722_1180 [Rhodovulum sp. ES.010]